MPDAVLTALADSEFSEQISLDRAVTGVSERTGATVGATAVRQELAALVAMLLGTVEEVPDEEVITAIRSVPCHY